MRDLTASGGQKSNSEMRAGGTGWDDTQTPAHKRGRMGGRAFGEEEPSERKSLGKERPRRTVLLTSERGLVYSI